MTEPFDAIWRNAVLATADAGGTTLEDGALAVRDGRIAWLGPTAALPASADTVVDVGGRLVTPGLVDCHTHLVFGGSRAHEFERRLAGESYATIARAGGGIVSTVRATRDASEDALFDSALPRLEQLLADGVTTVEIKSGYGLDTATEARMLRAARRLGDALPVTVRTSFLGAHALPPEYADDRKGYVDLVCNRMLPALADEGLVDAVDAFCETIAFTATETERVFAAATALDLPGKLHAEQLSDS
ncbi:MAG: imidazolonepropionase, partial [Pseudomonadota bacterium]